MYSLLILIGITSLVNAEYGSEDIDYGAREAQYYRVFATRGEHLGVDKTLEFLHSLDKDYYGKREAVAANKVRNLLSMSEIDKSKCATADFRKYKIMIEHESLYTVNIVPYLKHFMAKQFLVCKDQLERNILAQLSKIDKVNIQALRDDIIRANDKLNIVDQFFYIPRDAILKGSLEYFVGRSTQDLSMFTASKNGKQLFGSELQRLIGIPCGQVAKISKESLEILNLLKYDDKELMKQLEPDTLNLLVSAEICNKIEELSLKIISKHIYDNLKLRFMPPSHSHTCRLMSCFGQKTSAIK